MPRDSGGTYTLPAGNPVIPTTTISTEWANTTLQDIAAALSASMSVDGSVTPAKLSGDQEGFQQKIGIDVLLQTIVDRLDSLEAKNDSQIGMLAPFAMDDVPDDHLPASGQAVSRTTYAKLFNKIGTVFGSGDGATTFNVPDLRAYTVRGWDNGRGIDVGRVFGSNQADDNKSHTHGASSLAAGTHTHPGTTLSSGIHNHTASSGNAGAHSHTGSTSSDSHNHSGTTAAANTSYLSGSRQTSGSASSISIPLYGESTTGVMVDGHSVSGPYGVRFTNSATAHSHTFTTSTDAHSHTFTTSTAAAHNHTVTVNNSAAHTHTFTTDSSGSHTHTITVTATGSGEVTVKNVAMLYCIKAL
jgi:hypothetical protein